MLKIKHPETKLYIQNQIFENILNGCIRSTTCPRPVSLNCFSDAEKQHLKTTREKQLKDADCKWQSYICLLYIYIYIYKIYYI